MDQYLDMRNEALTVKEHLLHERMALWDQLYKEYVSDPIYQINVT